MAAQYYRNGPIHRRGNVDFSILRKKFLFRSIQVGHWVQPAERIKAANLIYDALSDLQLILGVPSEVISLRGNLSLAYGTGGQLGVQAHYEPGRRLLALAKNAGGGALAHEWFHAFDHYMSDKMFILPKHAFASHAWLLDSQLIKHPLNVSLAKVYQTIFLQNDSGEVSELFTRSATIDRRLKQVYFARPEEMSARCFEACIQGQSLKNSFLVSGTMQSEPAKLGLYPDATHRQQLAKQFVAYFSALGTELKAAINVS
ncbi:CLCA_X family protein [Gayadomonas joobiniege]|uniref:CLCA_X family protein n=1 Tax=Gayadomonas joobiniege TaxID=1234606 RepID=UPI000370D07D|nr:CLCA_X family protein [Gayadomonas joobiniege]